MRYLLNDPLNNMIGIHELPFQDIIQDALNDEKDNSWLEPPRKRQRRSNSVSGGEFDSAVQHNQLSLDIDEENRHCKSIVGDNDSTEDRQY